MAKPEKCQPCKDKVFMGCELVGKGMRHCSLEIGLYNAGWADCANEILRGLENSDTTTAVFVRARIGVLRAQLDLGEELVDDRG